MSNVATLFPSPEAAPDRFEEFWKAYPYPRRVGKAIARAKFEAITGAGLKTRTLDRDSGQYVEIELSATADEIVSGLKRYSDTHKLKGSGQFGFRDEGKFIMHPATFLNRGAWLDYE